MFRKSLVALTIGGGLFAAGAAQAQGFTLCNKTGHAIEVAKALNTGATDGSKRIIISEGWYKFAPGECSRLWSGELKYKFYLIYAQAKSVGKEWSGNVPICVSRDAFTINSDVCGAQHYRRNFIEVNTGDSKGFTYNLTP